MIYLKIIEEGSLVQVRIQPVTVYNKDYFTWWRKCVKMAPLEDGFGVE